MNDSPALTHDHAPRFRLAEASSRRLASGDLVVSALARFEGADQAAPLVISVPAGVSHASGGLVLVDGLEKLLQRPEGPTDLLSSARRHDPEIPEPRPVCRHTFDGVAQDVAEAIDLGSALQLLDALARG